MDDLLTARQARRIWEISNKTLFQWIDEGTVDLVVHRGKPYVRIEGEVPDELIKDRPGQQSISVELLRYLADEELEQQRETCFMKRVAVASLLSALAGLIFVEGRAVLLGRQVAGILMGALVAGFVFLLLITHAAWLFWLQKQKAERRSYLDRVARGVQVETSSFATAIKIAQQLPEPVAEPLKPEEMVSLGLSLGKHSKEDAATQMA